MSSIRAIVVDPSVTGRLAIDDGRIAPGWPITSASSG